MLIRTEAPPSEGWRRRWGEAVDLIKRKDTKTTLGLKKKKTSTWKKISDVHVITHTRTQKDKNLHHLS